MNHIARTAFASVAALAISNSQAAIPVGTKGHVDWLPYYGPVADKVCSAVINRKAGDWLAAEPSTAQNNIVLTWGNDCRTRYMQLDTEGKQPVDLLSASALPGTQPLAVPNSTAAPADWWMQPNLLPLTAPQPTIPDPRKIINVGQRQGCAVNMGDGTMLAIPTHTAVVTDTRHAWYVVIKNDLSNPSNTLQLCTIEPLVEIPAAVSPVTIAGGSLRNPGNISTAPLATTPAAAAAGLAGPAIEGSAMAIASAFNYLSRGFMTARPALMMAGRVIYNFGADALMFNREAANLSATEIGRLSQAAASTAAPTQGEVDDALKEANQPATARAIQLSDAHKADRTAGGNGTGGDCGPEKLQQMEADKDDICDQALKCTPNKTAPENLFLARLNAMCARHRDEIRKQCFDGGDDGHRRQSIDRWNAVQNCLDKITPR